MSKRVLNCFLGVVALFIGGMIYITCRPGTYLDRLFESVNIFPVGKGLLQISFYLPDFLWAFSLACFLCAIFLPKGRANIACGLTAFVVGTVWEGLQYSGLVGGTGDLIDIFMYLLSAVIATAINLKGTLK